MVRQCDRFKYFCFAGEDRSYVTAVSFKSVAFDS